MPWVIGAFLVLCLIAFPLFFILSEIAEPPTEGWKQLSEHTPQDTLPPDVLEALPPELQAEYLPKEPTAYQKLVDFFFYENFHQTILYKRSLYTLLMLGSVAVTTLTIGVGLAWMLSIRKFRGRGLLTFLLSLPIAIPTYIMATSYKLITTDFQLETSIKIKAASGAEAMQDFDHYWNLGLAIFVLTAAFYPYVFLAARTAFSTISTDYIESAKSLGRGKFHIFFKIIFPLARPAIIGGLMLVCLETLNEYGAMKIMGIETLLTEIFRIRSGADDLNTAVRVSGCLMFFIFVLLIVEFVLRGRKKFHASRGSTLSESAPKASLTTTLSIYLIAIIVLGLCFIVPLYELVRQAYHGLNKASISDFLNPILDSTLIAAQASILIISIALFLAYAQRKVPTIGMTFINKACSLGYAIPGAILGVALITWVGTLLQNNTSSPFIEAIFYTSTYGLIIAYAIRFLTIGINPAESGLTSIPRHLDEAAAQLGKSNIVSFFKVHFPLLRPSILAAFLVIFIDVLKELPLTLIMQPFNTETLATQTYSLFASQEEYALGSIPALILIFTGITGMVIIRFLIKPITRVSK